VAGLAPAMLSTSCSMQKNETHPNRKVVALFMRPVKGYRDSLIIYHNSL